MAAKEMRRKSADDKSVVVENREYQPSIDRSITSYEDIGWTRLQETSISIKMRRNAVRWTSPTSFLEAMDGGILGAESR